MLGTVPAPALAQGGWYVGLTKNISLRAERQIYLNVGDETLTGSSDVTVDLLGLAIQF